MYFFILVVDFVLCFLENILLEMRILNEEKELINLLFLLWLLKEIYERFKCWISKKIKMGIEDMVDRMGW